MKKFPTEFKVITNFKSQLNCFFLVITWYSRFSYRWLCKRHILVKYHIHAHRCDCQKYIIHCIVESIQHILTTIAGICIIKPQDITESHIFKDIPTHKIAYSSPKVSSMPKNQPTKTSEFDQSIVRKRCSLIAFFSHDSNPNMSSLYHIYIICTITNSNSHRSSIISSNKMHYICLLCWTCSVNNYRLSWRKQLIELLFHFSFSK